MLCMFWLYPHPNLNLFMVRQSMGFIMRREQEKKNQSHAPRMERKCNNHDILLNKKKGVKEVQNRISLMAVEIVGILWQWCGADREIIETWLVSKYSSTYIYRTSITLKPWTSSGGKLEVLSSASLCVLNSIGEENWYTTCTCTCSIPVHLHNFKDKTRRYLPKTINSS